MNVFRNDLKSMEYLRRLFKCIRIIDTFTGAVCWETLKEVKSCADMAFDYKKRYPFYEKCMSEKEVLYKIDYIGGKALLLAFLPIESGKAGTADHDEMGRYVLECITDLDKCTEAAICCSHPDGGCIQSMTDELTGLYNRRFINQTLPSDLLRCQNNGLPVSVIFADLDMFKDINDRYGHIVGDSVLCLASKEIKYCMKSQDSWVARYGGDEFFICMPEVAYENAVETAEIIRKSINEKMFNCANQIIDITCSLGVFTIDDYNTPFNITCDYILDEVDRRLYNAKRKGGNMVL